MTSLAALPLRTAAVDAGRRRAVRVVTAIRGARADAGAAALKTSDGAVKPAIPIAAGANNLADAEGFLGATNGNAREALGRPGAKRPDGKHARTGAG